MNAPGPPPTIPSRSRRFFESPAFAVALIPLAPFQSSLRYILLFLSTFNLQLLTSSVASKNTQAFHGYFRHAIPIPASADSPADPLPNSQNHQSYCSPPL